MKKRQMVNVRLVCLISLTVLCACNQSYPPDLPNQEEEVKATLVKMWETIENEDIELYASYVHPDFTQFGETDPVLKMGKDMGSTDGEAFSSRGKSTRIFVKEKGCWLCIHGHYTLLP